MNRRMQNAPKFGRTFSVLFTFSAAAAVCAPAISAQNLVGHLYGTHASPNGVALGDFNHDGFCDAVFVHQNGVSSPTFMNIHLGDGLGALGAPTSFTGTGPGGSGIIVGDWNQDSNLDAATIETNGNAAPSGRVSIFMGDGAGSFAPSTPLTVGAGSRQAFAADLNGDGILDIVTANSAAAANSVTVLIGSNVGSFNVLAETVAGSKPWQIAVADLNSDGAPDVATANNGGSSFSVLFNDGTGLFPLPASVYGTGTGPRGIAIDDLNGDGAKDVVTANGAGNNVTVYAGDGFGGFTLGSHFAVGTNPSSVTIGDVDGDGILDIATTDQTGPISNMESVLLGLGGLNFAITNNFTVGALPSSSKIGDMDGDGRADIVVANYGGSSITVLMNTNLPTGNIANFGVGTVGCFGTLGIAAPEPPFVGSTTFRMDVTNAPRNTLGLLIIGNAPIPLGADTFALGATFYVDLFQSTEIFAFDIHTDMSGVSSNSTPIPNDTNLTGLTYFAQGIFVESPGYHCSLSPFGVVTSRGLGLTITQ